MTKRFFLFALALSLAAPLAAAGVQRSFRSLDREGGGVRPSQIWRVTSLSMEQRKQLAELQFAALKQMRNSGESPGRGGRRDLVGRMRDVQARMEQIVTPAQLDEARRKPDEPLAPEELIYFPVTSLKDLEPARRSKIDAVFASVAQDIRADGSGFRARNRESSPDAEKKNEATRQRRLALFEVLDALLTRDQMLAVKQFLPEQIRNVGLRERVVYRLPSLTMEQEAQARAVFAALEDETSADVARRKAIESELASGSLDADKRATLAAERRDLDTRVTAREKSAYAELTRVLTPEQMKELEAGRPGPPRPLVFRPEAIRELDLTPAQQAKLGDALRQFQRGTVDERREAASLREQVKGSDPQALEMAGVRDQLRKASMVLDAERDRITRTVADTLTGAQLAELMRMATK